MAIYWSGQGTSTPLTNEEQRALGLSTLERYYRFMNSDDRLTLWVDGVGYRPEDGLIHNFGSIPYILQVIPAFRRDHFPNSYVLHDQPYRSQRRMWVNRTGAWEYIEVTKRQADLLLKYGILAEDGTRFVAGTVYQAVRIFGGCSWPRSA